MSWTCLACGYISNGILKTCICGHHFEESVPVANEKKEMVKKQVKVPEKPVRSDAGEHVIKEIDSWVFTFSQSDKYICIGTPALQSFKLKLSLDDLEELLESVYQMTGEEKTMRKLRLSVEEIPDLIDNVERLIEQKKSMVPLKFTSNELKEIEDFINGKLKV